MNHRLPVRIAAVLSAALLSITGCGTRVDHQAVIAGAGQGTVSLDPASIAALKAAAAGAMAAAGNHADPTRSTATGGARPAGTGSAAGPAALDSPPRGAPRTSRTAPVATGVPGAEKASTAAALTKTPDPPCTASGATLKLGQIGSFSGVAGPITASARTTLATWAQVVNAAGGISCHPVVVYQVDDGADQAKAAAAVQDLVQNKGVQGLVGVFDVLGFAGILSGVDRATALS